MEERSVRMGPILVTGATGFLGGAVVRELVVRGRLVRATGRNLQAGSILQAAGIPFTPCDLSTDPLTLDGLTDGCEAVIHAAALSAPWGRRRDFVAANVTATENVISSCAKAGVRRMVYISSPSVNFAFQNQAGLKEESPWKAPAANHYIATKRQAEYLARKAGAVTLRPRALFGAGDTALLPRLVRVARRGVFPLFGSGDPLLELTWIGDAVTAILLAMDAPDECRGRIYHITSGDPLPRSVVLATLLQACGLAVRFRRVPIGLGLRIAGVMEAVSRGFTGGAWEPPLTRYTVGALGFEQTYDITAARRDLGFAPKTNVRRALSICGEAWRQKEAAT